MDAQELKNSQICVGEDLYGASVEQLRERLAVLQAEALRVEAEIAKKDDELSRAESFFKNS